MTHEPKRRYASRRPKTLALGTITAAGVGLAGCGDNFEGDYSFTTVQDCVEEGIQLDICEAEYQTALTEHVNAAPRFASVEECEAEFGEGRCNEIPEVGARDGETQSFFMPFLTGYLVSSALRNVSDYAAYRSYRSENAGYYSKPVYRDRAGRAVTTVREPGATKPTVRPLNQNTRTVARRGFGGRAVSRGWGG